MHIVITCVPPTGALTHLWFHVQGKPVDSGYLTQNVNYTAPWLIDWVWLSTILTGAVIVLIRSLSVHQLWLIVEWYLHLC